MVVKSFGRCRPQCWRFSLAGRCRNANSVCWAYLRQAHLFFCWRSAVSTVEAARGRGSNFKLAASFRPRAAGQTHPQMRFAWLGCVSPATAAALQSVLTKLPLSRSFHAQARRLSPFLLSFLPSSYGMSSCSFAWRLPLLSY